MRSCNCAMYSYRIPWCHYRPRGTMKACPRIMGEQRGAVLRLRGVVVCGASRHVLRLRQGRVQQASCPGAHQRDWDDAS
jgi:hypothetical protein